MKPLELNKLILGNGPLAKFPLEVTPASIANFFLSEWFQFQAKPVLQRAFVPFLGLSGCQLARTLNPIGFFHYLRASIESLSVDHRINI